MQLVTKLKSVLHKVMQKYEKFGCFTTINMFKINAVKHSLQVFSGLHVEFLIKRSFLGCPNTNVKY